MKQVPDYGNVMEVDEWLDDVTAGALIDYDGHGHPSFDGGKTMDENVTIVPSGKHYIPKQATHIVWFNR